MSDRIPPEVPLWQSDEKSDEFHAEVGLERGPKKTGPPVFTLLTCLSWLVILTGTISIAGLVALGTFGAKDGNFTKADLIQSLAVGKYLLGGVDVFGPSVAASFDLSQLNDGTLEQRFCYTILVNEFEGAQAAQKALQAVSDRAEQHGVKPDNQQARLRQALAGLFADYQKSQWQGPSVTISDQQFLRDALGWFGDLALSPKGKQVDSHRAVLIQRARFTFLLAMGFVLSMLLALIVGFLGMIAFLVMTAKKYVRSATVDQSMHGGIYAETFAIWFVLFFGGSVLAELFGIKYPGLSMLFSLTALIWPRFRGVSAAQLREHIGWKLRNPFKEALAGLGAYLSMLPFLAMALVVTQTVMVLVNSLMKRDDYAPAGGVSHPIINELLGADPWWAILHVFFLTVIVAPIVEETMFRGVLFRHLRDATSRWGRVASVAFAALVSSIEFAVIHPQGIFGVPLLVPLAFGFSLVRQWRGSLVGPMVMHGIHNFLVTTALVLMLV